MESVRIPNLIILLGCQFPLLALMHWLLTITIMSSVKSSSQQLQWEYWQDPTGGYVNGIGTNAKFNIPTGVSISPDGSYALVAEYYNHPIRQIIISSALVSVLAGLFISGLGNGIGTNAQFNYPTGVSISPDGSYALKFIDFQVKDSPSSRDIGNWEREKKQ